MLKCLQEFDISLNDKHLLDMILSRNTMNYYLYLMYKHACVDQSVFDAQLQNELLKRLASFYIFIRLFNYRID